MDEVAKLMSVSLRGEGKQILSRPLSMKHNPSSPIIYPSYCTTVFTLIPKVTPPEALSPPPLSSAYQRAVRKGKKYY